LDGVQGSAEEEAPISDAIEVYHQYGFADGQLTASPPPHGGLWEFRGRDLGAQ